MGLMAHFAVFIYFIYFYLFIAGSCSSFGMDFSDSRAGARLEFDFVDGMRIHR